MNTDIVEGEEGCGRQLVVTRRNTVKLELAQFNLPCDTPVVPNGGASLAVPIPAMLPALAGRESAAAATDQSLSPDRFQQVGILWSGSPGI